MSEMVATPVLEELPTTGEAGDGGLDVISSLRDGSANEDFSAGIDSVVATAGTDGAADSFDLVAVANGEEKLDAATGIDSAKSASETTASRISAVCTGMASAACLSCAARGDCSLLRMWGAAESRQPDPERQSYVEELLSDDNNLVVAGYADSRESLDSEEGYSSKQANNTEVTVDTEDTTSEPELSFKDDLAGDGNKESSVKPMVSFGEAESAEKPKKPEGSEESGQPRMEAVRDDPKEQTSGDSQLLSIKHEISALDDTSDDTETETLASEGEHAVQETPVAIAPEAAPAVVSTALKPDKSERVDKSPAANHSQGSPPDLSKKANADAPEDKSHDVLAATEITAAVAGAPTENPAPVQKVSDSKVIESTEREQKAQSQNLESLKTAVDDTLDTPVTSLGLNAKNNAGSNPSNPGNLNPPVDTRQHDKSDELDMAATDSDIDRVIPFRAVAGPEKSAGAASATYSHYMSQAESKPSTSSSSSPRTNDYGNEAPALGDSLQKDTDKEPVRLDNGSFVSPAEVGDLLISTTLVADESASATAQMPNLEQQPAVDDEPNNVEISVVTELVKPTKHSENISPTEQSTNDVLNTTYRETISVEPDLENDMPLRKPATRKVDFALSRGIDDIDNTQAATYPAVEAKPAIDKDNKTEESQKAAANWASEDKIFVVKKPPEMPHFADDEMNAVTLVDDKIEDLSETSQVIPLSVPASEIAAINQYSGQKISENLGLETNADLVSDSLSPSELSSDPEVNMEYDLISGKPETLSKLEVTEPDMMLNSPIDQPEYKSDDIEEPQQTIALPNESETVYVDLRSGRATGENSAAKKPSVADQISIKPEATLSDLLGIADGERDDVIAGNAVVKDIAADGSIVNNTASGTLDFEQNSELPVAFSDQTQAADYDDPARQSASNDEAEDTHRIAFAHPLSGLWTDDSQLNPELTAITTSQSNISDISLVSRLVGMAVVALCVMRGRRSARV